MSAKSFAEAVKDGITRYTRAFGIEQAEAEEKQFASVGSDGTVGGPGGTALSPSVVSGSATAVVNAVACQEYFVGARVASTS